LEVSLSYLFDHRFVQGKLRDQLLQSLVFIHQVLEALGLLQSYHAIFLAPAVIALLTDACLANGLGHGLPLASQHLDLPQLGDDLLRANALHGVSISSVL